MSRTYPTRAAPALKRRRNVGNFQRFSFRHDRLPGPANYFQTQELKLIEQRVADARTAY
jgi:hypothetical protein